MDGGGENSFINKRFVSESEIEERRQRRQEEWEKVRKPEDPVECPEEVYDPRSLYERLQEQKEKKQQEYEEQFQFKNMVRGLDEDETNFLDEVSRQQLLVEKHRREEEMKELKEYRSSLTKRTASTETKKDPEKKAAASSVRPSENKKFSQAKLLAGAVKRKSSEGPANVKKQKTEDDQESNHQVKASWDQAGSNLSRGPVVHHPSAAICIGILPGLGAYSESSDSESSTDSEDCVEQEKR
ncbi:PSME3-interacting protein isoform X2 [Latimeria chalumnae]|uniref:PSME3-interacting protein isoform X2 n=1 Tax=Latimeria chalumnae TaxID=7897 RepID=UPI00313F0063